MVICISENVYDSLLPHTNLTIILIITNSGKYELPTVGGPEALPYQLYTIYFSIFSSYKVSLCPVPQAVVSCAQS